MALWGFNRESTQVNSGANTVAGIKAGYQPPFVAGGHGAEMAEKRNIIATKNGWVRREVRVMTGVENATRIIDQEIVAGNPGGGFNYTANTFLGKPDIAQIYVRLNANGFISANSSGANLYIVFNTPIAFAASGNTLSVTVSNTAAGNNAIVRARKAATSGQIGFTSVTNANNTLVILMTKLQGSLAPDANNSLATYKFPAQTISITGNPLYNPDQSAVHSTANLVITGAVSNNLCDGSGSRIGSFQVRRNG